MGGAWPSGAGAVPLTIAVTPSAVSLPVTVADTQGFFKDEGLEVQVVDCNTGPVCMRDLADGRARMTTVTELPVVMASFARRDFAVVGTIATSTGNIRMIARKSAGIAGAADLKHKRIGVIFGTSSHYYLYLYLLFHGIDPQDVEIVLLPADGVAAAIQQRRVDALAAFSRHAGAVSKLLQGDSLVLDDPRIYTETYNLVADRKLLETQPDDVVKVLRALARAERFIIEQPLLARQILRARPGFDAAGGDVYGTSVNYRLGLEQSLLATMEGAARWAIREGHVRSASAVPNYLDFVDYGPLRAAKSGALTARK